MIPMMEVRDSNDCHLIGYLPKRDVGIRYTFRLWLEFNDSNYQDVHFDITYMMLPGIDSVPFLVYKSKGHPIELLRKIPPFVEATPDEIDADITRRSMDESQGRKD